MDDDHSLAVYDIDKVKQARINASNDPMEGVLAFGKNTPVTVWQIKFTLDDKFIIAGCYNEVAFLTYYGGILKKTKGVFDPKTVPSSALSIGFIPPYTVTGMFKGELIVWNGN